MKRPIDRKVALIGIRYGNLAVGQQMLGRLGVKLAECPGQNETEIVAAAQGAQVIVCGGAPKISAAVIRRLPELKAVIRSGIGVDTVDLTECTRRGIYVANVPDYCVEEVAAHALTLILAWTRKLPVAWSVTRSGRWEVGPLKPLQSPADLVVGLVGFGRIAQTLCRMARATGFQVWASDPYVSRALVLGRGARPVSLKRLVRGADFISLHRPLTTRTRRIIDAARLQEMKPTAYLVNTARGDLIDEAAMRDALDAGRIAGAALDVMENEPPVGNHPLRSMDNVIITPHCAWYSERAQQELRRQACAQAIQVLRSQVPNNLVNKAVLR